ncbi:hypothetical protein [Chlamydia pecorum]|uniref:hypothetical protein n=1 Tax=Chlamydia pecorum TaxID=85991 RepID=UPI0003D3E30C|nr:hypothetical protein [Chlamydia pecorum]ETF37409.1 hypothetical protein CpecS_0603 [Chlamydia pecorum VR629]
MMTSKRTSQLALLSVFLIFSHDVGYASSGVAVTSSMTYVRPSAESKAEKEPQARKRQPRKFVQGKDAKSLRQKKGLFSFFQGRSDKSVETLSRKTVKSRQALVRAKSPQTGDQVEPQIQFRPQILINSESAQEKEEEASLQELVSNVSLPVFLLPNLSAMEQSQKALLLQELIKDQKAAKRKSARQTLEAREGVKLARDGRVTSTLRYDVEKAAATREKRKASIHPRVRSEKSSYARRERKSGVSKSEIPQKEEKSAEASRVEDFYGNVLAKENTNIGSYLDAKQSRCDSSETDWPCPSCVSKRRAHASISVCTMVVTVIAMIVGALIISNASDSPTSSGSGSTGSGAATNP